MRYRAAAIQFDPTLGDKEGNVTRLLELTAEAAHRGASLIVMPEMATTGYCWSSREEIAPVVEPIPGPTVDRFAHAAASSGTWIVVALPELEVSTGAYYNSAVLIGPEGIAGRYRKTHPYITEVRWARDGDLGLPVFETPIGRLGILICMDAEYPEPARVLGARGCDVVCFPTNWLSEHSPSAYWIQRAWENGAYWIASNRFGLERGVQFSGGSTIIGPDGQLLDEVDDGEGIAIAEIDLETARRDRTARFQGRRPSQYADLMLSSYLWPGAQLNNTDDSTALDGIGSMVSPASVSLVTMPAGAIDRLEAELDRATFGEPNVIAVLPPASEVSRDLPVREAAEIAARRLDELEAISKRRGIVVVVSAPIIEGGVSFDGVVLLGSAEGRLIHRNTHPLSSKAWATPGNVPPPVSPTRHGILGIISADELLPPEPLRGLAARGAEFCGASGALDYPAPVGVRATAVPLGSSQQRQADPQHWLLPRVRAAENNLWLAFANAGSVPSGIFGPAFYRVPRREKLNQDGAAFLTFHDDPNDRDRRMALEKPYLRMRYPHLYATLTGSRETVEGGG